MNGNTRNCLYFLGLSPALLVIYGNITGGAITLANLVFTLIFLGFLEWITPSVSSNKHTSKSDIIPQLVLYLHVVFQILALFSLFYGIWTQRLSGIWIITASISNGLNSGTSAIVIAHEFIHQKSKISQRLGRFLLFTAGNLYFFIDHISVHHKWVGTSKDHATARKGESLYRFFLRTVQFQLLGSVDLEAKRLHSKKMNGYSLKNYVVRQLVLQLGFSILLFFTLGYMAFFAWVVQCVLANFLLEYVNYIEHYGLERDERQRVTEVHSWNSNKFFSRFILVDLSRHADHHFYASKPFHTLNSYPNSPELPSGYAGMFFVAAIPPLWKYLIHPRLPKTYRENAFGR